MRRQTAMVLAVLLALVGLAGSPGATRHGDQAPVTAIVSLTNEASASALRGVRVVSELPAIGAVVVSATTDALLSLRGRQGVRSITPNYKLRPTSNDNNAGAGSVYAGSHLGGRVATGGAGDGVMVAVVDTGISDTPALNRASGRLHDGIDTSGTGSFNDGYGHGTFLANLVAGGTAPGSGDNTLGVAPAADVVNVKVADDNGDTSLDQVLYAFSWINYFAANIDIVEFAFSGDRPSSAYGPDPLTDAVERLRASGILVVVASGNVSAQLGDPGFDPYALTVGAADLRRSSQTAVASFSGYGNVHGVTKPDVVASGVGVLSLLPADSLVARSNPQSRQPNGLYRGSGTSQATAITAGLAATVLARYPAATATDLKTTLRSSTRSISGAGGGQGLVKVPSQLVTSATKGKHNAGTGEEDLDVAAWLSNSWLDGSWVEPNNAAWDGQRWAGQRWAGQTWVGNAWDGQRWAGQAWAGQRWAGQSWLDPTWDGQRWAGQTWQGQTWTAQRWLGQTWNGQTWSGQTWAGQTWTGQTWNGQTWSGQTWAGQTWTGQTWTGQTWSAQTWAGRSWS